jgi:hypothetical protein
MESKYVSILPVSRHSRVGNQTSLCAHSRQLTVTKKTVEKHVLHYSQLYEQLRMKKATSIEMA